MVFTKIMAAFQSGRISEARNINLSTFNEHVRVALSIVKMQNYLTVKRLGGVLAPIAIMFH